MRLPTHPRSVKGRLLAWIIVPTTVFILIDTFVLYRNALDAANTAYDRMLVTTAYSVGDALRMEGGQLQMPVSYAALEVYEVGYLTRMLYAVRRMDGTFLAGDRALAPFLAKARPSRLAPALLHIYESNYGSARIRVAATYQPPAAGAPGEGVIIQIAELMENRTSVALSLLRGTLMRQAILLMVVVLATMIAVKQALLPLSELKMQLDARQDEELAPLVERTGTPELAPVVGALNALMARLQRVLGIQQRFVSDASHQLRTPLAVLKAQIQSGLRGDAPPATILAEISVTAERAVNLANKMLSLAKVEQLRGHALQQACDIASIAQDVAVDLSPLISEKNIDFAMEGGSGAVAGHPWMIFEMISNLMHNAIRHTPPGARMGVRIDETVSGLTLTVWDSGSGLASDMQDRLFVPFSATQDSKGCGLGLKICAEIADSMGATLTLNNRIVDGRICGLDACLHVRK